MKENLLTDSHKFKLSVYVLSQEIDNELIFLNIKDEKYFGLDKTGTIFWKAMMDADSLEDAYNMLLGEFDVEPSTLLNDMNDLIHELEKSGLVEIYESV